ncbi:flagellar hook-length control protein FliK [[Clostridium] fimetarium]|uniref:Hook-length control protein FliK n=1 Tax=[Clostridium] fimetarium TaxID=99656 RepID=A0A1I0RIA7_9FIRM|nr:flagellar hook-length control protein FliK [[Clostridium] fimetarium]SEW40657.1 hook-length control protein FliK [[Clostridium] fimetarium]
MNLNIGNFTSNTTNDNNAKSNTVTSNTTNSNAATSNTSGNINVNNNTVTISGATAATALAVLKNMLVGDTFSGHITNIKGNDIILQLNNGMSFPATLLGSSNLSVGQNITFMINNNSNNKISIKPLMLDQQELVIVNRALEASNLPFSENNVQLVKQLLMQNMSIDTNTLNNLSKEINKFSSANIDTIVSLSKLDIPITEENIKQFEAYKSYEHSISNDMNTLSKSFGDFLSSSLNKNGINDAVNLSQKLIDILYNTNTSSANNSNMNTNSNINDSNINNGNANNSMNTVDINKALLSEQGNNMAGNSENNAESINKFISTQSRKDLAQNMIETFGKEASFGVVEDLKSGNLSAKSLLENINQLVKDNPMLNKDGLDKLFQSKEFSEIIRMIVRDKMRITPENVKNSDGIKEFYKRVREDVSHLSDVASQSDKESSFSKSLDGLKNNIDFMNDLNKNMSYFQLPIKFSAGDAESELYVFTNKKKSSDKTDTLSALLHLDMENLGPLDVFIKLAGKNISTNFCLESENMLDFVYSHIDQLNSKLESLGYNVNFEMTVREDDKLGIDFVQDFLDQSKSAFIPSQFIFDTKA